MGEYCHGRLCYPTHVSWLPSRGAAVYIFRVICIREGIGLGAYYTMVIVVLPHLNVRIWNVDPASYVKI